MEEFASEELASSPEIPHKEYNKVLVVFAGAPGSGKSTLASILNKHSNVLMLDVDAAKRELKSKMEFDSDSEAMQAAYAYNHTLARKALDEGKSVALVATYSRPSYQEDALSLSSSTETPMVVFNVEGSEEKVREALRKRQENPNELSDVTTYEHHLEVKNRLQKFQHDQAIDIHTEGNTPQETFATVQSALQPYEQRELSAVIAR